MYEELLKEWCDALVRLQLTERKEEFLYGGILCPNCARIHGRSGDAIYPMMAMYKRTGDRKYLDCAKRLFFWTEKNMMHPDGSMQNDTNSDWRGITVFYVIQLCEALLHYGELLDEETGRLWRERCLCSAVYLRDNIEKIGGNINYPVTCSHAMAVAWELSGDESFRRKAEELSVFSEAHLTAEGILYGEGKPPDMVSKKGCRPVDLGYNVEESLPALASCARILKKKDLLSRVREAMTVHLEFMLPDGAWDNSWGTRNNKWSYWGSRTSDGCQEGYAGFAKESPEFGEAVYRNTLLLKRCTHGGLLYGGPMYEEAGELPCVHHTICHAKALAAMIRNHPDIPVKRNVPLPRERQGEIRFFTDMHVALLKKGDFYATVSDYDVAYSRAGHAAGGTVTLLYHEAVGPILAAGMNRYYLVEPNNMQFFRRNEIACTTPRLEWRGFTSMEDKEAEVSFLPGCTLRVRGRLTDEEGRADAPYFFEYTLSGDSFLIRGCVDGEEKGEETPCFYLPVISSHKEKITWEKSNGFYIERPKAALIISASHRIEGEKAGERRMNPVGGFEVIPAWISIPAGREFYVKLQIAEREEKNGGYKDGKRADRGAP